MFRLPWLASRACGKEKIDARTMEARSSMPRIHGTDTCVPARAVPSRSLDVILLCWVRTDLGSLLISVVHAFLCENEEPVAVILLGSDRVYRGTRNVADVCRSDARSMIPILCSILISLFGENKSFWKYVYLKRK